jgi:hypothetical protein
MPAKGPVLASNLATKLSSRPWVPLQAGPDLAALKTGPQAMLPAARLCTPSSGGGD